MLDESSAAKQLRLNVFSTVVVHQLSGGYQVGEEPWATIK